MLEIPADGEVPSEVARLRARGTGASAPDPASRPPAATESASPVRRMRALLDDCFAHRRAIYWTDLALTLAVAYPCVAWFLFAPEIGPAALAAYVVGGFALYRVGTFIHEIQHMGRGRFRAFKVAWNLACGIPLLMPSLMYENHVDHHSVRRYGTAGDSEYLTLGSGPPRRVAVYLLQVPLLPILAIFRFGVLAPISLLHPRLRRAVLERASSYGINLAYRRELPASTSYPLWALVDLACFAWVAGIAALLVTGVLPWSWLARLYAFVTFTIGLNWLRNLGAHRFLSGGAAQTRSAQLLDSVTITGPPLLVELLFPVGLRYHALHHMFPSIPYHELGRAHRRLLAELPPDAPYRRTLFPSFRAAARSLLRDARAAGAGAATQLSP